MKLLKHTVIGLLRVTRAATQSKYYVDGKPVEYKIFQNLQWKCKHMMVQPPVKKGTATYTRYEVVILRSDYTSIMPKPKPKRKRRCPNCGWYNCSVWSCPGAY